MKLSEHQRSRSFFDLDQRHSDFKVKCLTFGLYTQVNELGPLGPLVLSPLVVSKTVVTISVLCMCLHFVLCVYMCPSGFVWAMTCTVVHGFQNNVA